MEAATVTKESSAAKTGWRKKCVTLKRKCDQIEQVRYLDDTDGAP